MELLKVIVETYEKAEQTEEDALRNLRLARILQAEDWDKENKSRFFIALMKPLPPPVTKLTLEQEFKVAAL